jgi:hypothetical protein
MAWDFDGFGLGTIDMAGVWLSGKREAIARVDVRDERLICVLTKLAILSTGPLHSRTSLCVAFAFERARKSKEREQEAQ